MAVRMRPVDVARAFRRSADWLRDLEGRGVIPPAPRVRGARGAEHVISLARLLVRFELRRAERAVDQPYDRSTSRRIDRLRTALEALSDQ